MKISRHKSGDKSLEIATTDTDDSFLSLQGDTTIESKNRTTGEKSSVMDINQHGEVDFSQRPKVAGADVVTTEDQPYNLDSKNATVVNDRVTTIALVPLEPMITVIYRLQNENISECGTITITSNDASLTVTSEQQADTDAFAKVSFNARIDNGSILLDVEGYGSGETLTMIYRVNAINSLYI